MRQKPDLDPSSLAVKKPEELAQTKEDHATLSYFVILPLFSKSLVVLTLLELLGITEVYPSLAIVTTPLSVAAVMNS